jgi:hypothetical protein
MRVPFLLLVLVGCEGTIVGAPGAAGPGSAPGSTDEAPTTHIDGPQYVTAACEGVGTSRTYRGLDTRTLEATRADSAFELDRRTTRTWDSTAAWGADMNEKLGYWKASDGLTQDALVPVRKNSPGAEYVTTAPSVGALELYSQFRLAFIMCTRLLENPPPADSLPRTAFVVDAKTGQPLADYRAAPTAESAPRRCTSMMRRFWKMVPTQEQVDACAQFAVVETASLATTPAGRWAAVCAAVLTSSQTLTQ